jgi:hemolysin activation/secretion protein
MMMTKAGLAATLLLSGAALAPLPALAQTGALPPPTDLARPQAPIERPRTAPPVVASELPEALAVRTLSISSASVLGSSVYPVDAFTATTEALVGPQVPLARVAEAAAAIEARYRRDGYALVRVAVPEAVDADGVLRLHIVEGRISSVTVQGDVGGTQALVEAIAARAQAQASVPLRTAALERALLLANDVPGLEVRGVLSADPAAPGGTRLILEVTHDPVDVFATASNRGSRAAGPVTVATGMTINTRGRAPLRIGMVGYGSIDGRQLFAELSAQRLLGPSGLSLRSWGSIAASNPGDFLSPLDIRSRTLTGGLTLSYPVVRTRALNVGVQGTFDVSNDRTRILGQAFSEDRLRVLRLGANAEARDLGGGTSSLTVTLHQGIAGLGASADGGALPQSRLGGDAGFTKVTVSAVRAQPLWQNDTLAFGVVASVSGQLSDGRLLSLEQFNIGGEALGRGYNPAQGRGDDGIGGSVEFQLSRFAPLGPLRSQQLYGFFDGARAYNRGAGSERFLSAGAGLRADLGRDLSAQVEVAVPFEDGRLIGNRRDTGAQFFFRLTARH